MGEFWHPDIDPDFEPHKVLIKKDKFIDESRDGRDIPLKIYYPTDHNQKDLPVVVWSHGLGGSVDGASFISRFLASHGYVIVHVQHRGTDSSLWEGKEGHPWDIIRNTHIPRSATLNRFYDVPFVLDHLPGLMEKMPEVGEIADLSNMGMSGHSFGAMTTQVMAGQMFPDEDQVLQRLYENRFKAGILYSPVPIAHLSDEDPSKLYGAIDMPLFHMTGTDDSSPVEGFDYTKRLAVHEHSGHDDKYLLVMKDGDHMVFNGSRGKLGDNPNRALHENIIKVNALSFWDAHLKDDDAAKEYLDKYKS